MTSAHDFKLSSCQAVLFTPDEEVSIRKFLDGPGRSWSNRFDGDPVVLPATEIVSREIPRVILRNAAGDWRCHLASARLDLFWQRTAPGGTSPGLGEFFQEASSLLSEYRRLFEVRAARLAAVVARYVSNESPGRFLASHFCQERWLSAPLNRPESFELHARKAYMFADLCRINSWVRNKTGVIPAESSEPIILVEQDLNTLAEETETRAFSDDQIRGFFLAAPAELDQVLSLYYPASA
jgi:hypothetical protein